MGKDHNHRTSTTTTTTSETRTANEWGIPDWRDGSAYGDTKDWNWFRWRWEFFRRRDDLRAAFDDRAQQSYQNSLEFLSAQGFAREDVLKPCQRGFTAQAYETDDFGYFGIPNPRISDQPSLCIGGCEPRPEQIKIFGTTADCEAPSEVVIGFDLERPIGPQIKSAQDALQRMQKRLFGKKIQKRAHTGKWLTYIRVLDAREAGASWSEISTILEMTAGTEQSARDTWEAANALRFNF